MTWIENILTVEIDKNAKEKGKAFKATQYVTLNTLSEDNMSAEKGYITVLTAQAYDSSPP